MKNRTSFKILFPILLLLIFALYLSAPFPNDSPGCCSIEPNPIIDFASDTTACDNPESSSCTEFSSVEITSIKRLCALYLPNSSQMERCPKTRITTCYVRGSSVKKIYLATGSTPWDLSSAETDCSNLGGSLE
ncbi:hypothetical protein [Leptospira venezuelensis]|uniref:hypothetical protein n=1 Tax=Leptospira venezuelensis TaxID=1958811 RepID=UPI000A3CC81F|nr:hypothetical protein [Leptospira venezuelensis]